MAEVQDDILAEGAEIIWVLERDADDGPGTARNCRATIDTLGGTSGWCVGDRQTQPESGVFNRSPFAQGRGFDILVDRRTMRIGWTTSHGTTDGNENLSAEEVLQAVRQAAAALRAP